MKAFLSSFVGKKIDVVCTGGVTVRGEVMGVAEDILTLKDDDDKVCYVVTEKITVVYETEKSQRKGFVGGFAGRK